MEEMDLSHEERGCVCVLHCLFLFFKRGCSCIVYKFVLLFSPVPPQQELSDHALYMRRMRLKRLWSKTSAGKLNVPQDIADQWMSGNRDELSLALVRALKIHGFDNSHKTRKVVRDWRGQNCTLSSVVN